MNKKAMLVDFGLTFVSFLVIFILGALLMYVMGTRTDNKIQDFNRKIVELDSSFSTRTILRMELSPDYRVYNFILDAVNDEDYDLIKSRMPGIITAYAGEKDPGEWAYYVDGHIGSFNTGNIPREALIVLEKVQIPNPEGEDVEILIKRISNIDFEVEAQGEIMYHPKQFK